jgi:hypothetical protein
MDCFPQPKHAAKKAAATTANGTLSFNRRKQTFIADSLAAI